MGHLFRGGRDAFVAFNSQGIEIAGGVVPDPLVAHGHRECTGDHGHLAAHAGRRQGSAHVLGAVAVAGERASQKLDFEFLKQRNVDPADGYVPEYRADHPVDPAPIVHQGGRGHDRGLQVALEDGGESGAGVPCSVEGFSAQAVEVGPRRRCGAGGLGL